MSRLLSMASTLASRHPRFFSRHVREVFWIANADRRLRFHHNESGSSRLILPAPRIGFCPGRYGAVVTLLCHHNSTLKICYFIAVSKQRQKGTVTEKFV